MTIPVVTRVAKRVIDLVVASLGLVVGAPVLLAAAVAILVSRSGPVLFTQQRIGRGGTEFTILKFRTMTPGTYEAVLADAEAHRRYVDNGYKLDLDDPRITRVGRILRATSLDELPQLLNVLRGQMSIVGIRPLVRDEFLERSGHDRALYASLRPGLTGLWQVVGRSSIGPVDRLVLDRTYAEQVSIRRDLGILLRTPAALLRTADSR